MHSMTQENTLVVGGVDAHADTHHAAALDERGALLATKSFPTSTPGSALTDATSVKDGKLRFQVLISELEHRGYESAASCLAEDLDALVVHLRYPLRHRERWRLRMKTSRA